MRVHLCGVRGSTPAPGEAFAGVGGHTSCVAVEDDDGEVRLVLDAGTGVRHVTHLLRGRPFRGTIVLTHLHWDHVQGLPFFSAADREDAVVSLLAPRQDEEVARVLGRSLGPPHFPIGPEGLRGQWTFAAIDPGRHRVDGFDLDVAEVPHKGGRTLGLRMGDGSASFAYIPDHAPAAPPSAEVVHLVSGVDVLAHGAAFDDRSVAEGCLARAFGHATVAEASALARRGGVGRLVLVHHAPDRDDDQIAEIVDDARLRWGGAGLTIDAGREGDVLSLGRTPRLSAHPDQPTTDTRCPT